MGHLVGKDVYRKLGRKIDHLTFRVPWNETMHEILRELYSPEEADLVVRMPYGLSTLNEVERVSGVEPPNLNRLLEGLCDKGLVMDMEIEGEYRYTVSPLVIGVFEFTMMRTGEGLDRQKMARLFHQYLGPGGVLHDANFGHGESTTIMRTLPHAGTIRNEEFVEILDYEKAREIVNDATRFSMGLCSCRHEKQHLGTNACEAPMDNCSSLGGAADYLIRHHLAREVSREEMLENVDRSRELGLVMNADNVQRNVTFICHCCGCCCNMLASLTDHGYTHAVVTSSFIARSNDERCKGCNHCEKACPIDAISMVADEDPTTRRKKKPEIDREFCLGCGVCATACTTGAMKLDERDQRVIPPESTFQRVILSALDRGTLQYQLFDDPSSVSHAFLRGFVGGFLKLPPVKRALLSDQLRSRFLSAMESGIQKQGKGWVTEM
ncbi:MAG: 4Fe-4S dicluster domain-containing protein [Acidobacteriota bacterium]